MIKDHKNIIILISVWLIINLITAASVQLSADEAYYWVYGYKLDWGYFDHPPMIAFLNSWIDRNILHHEISVRLLSVLCGGGYLYVLYKFIKPTNWKIFSLLVFSSLAINIFGFISVPDSPLLFLSGLFYLAYTKYIKSESKKSILALSIIVPLLFYTKYHAVLIVFFSVLAYPKIFTRKSFYFIALLSTIIYLPHIFWQVANNYPSIKYHLFERNSSQYNFLFTLDYLLNQITFYGPIATIAALLYIFKNKVTKEDLTNRILIFNYIGFIIFFTFSSFKGWVEVNWTIPMLTVVNYFAYKYLEDCHINFRKLFVWVNTLAIILLIIYRIHLIHPFYRFHRLDRAKEFHGHKEFASQLKNIIGDKELTAVRYQESALLSYYTNSFVPSCNIDGRKNIFTTWKTIPSLHNTPRYILSEKIGHNKIVDPKGMNYLLDFYDNFPSYEGVKIENLNFVNDTIILDCNTDWIKWMIENPSEHNTNIKLLLKKEHTNISLFNQNELDSLSKTQFQSKSYPINITLKKELKLNKGRYETEIYLQTDKFGIWSERFSKNLVIE